MLRSESREDEDRLWDVRRALSPAIKKFGTLKFNEDVVVPRSRVPEFIERVEEIGQKYDTFVVNFGHLGDGNIHVNFMCERSDPEAVARARAAVGETFAVSVELRRHHQRRARHRLRQSPLSEDGARRRDHRRHAPHQARARPNGILNPARCLCVNSNDSLVLLELQRLKRLDRTGWVLRGPAAGGGVGGGAQLRGGADGDAAGGRVRGARRRGGRGARAAPRAAARLAGDADGRHAAHRRRLLRRGGAPRGRARGLRRHHARRGRRPRRASTPSCTRTTRRARAWRRGS